MSNILPSHRFIFLSTVMMKNRRVAASETGKENSEILSVILNEPKREGIPMTANVLKMFDPTILPIVISGFPFLAAEIVTITSGSDVPREITLRAMTSAPIFNILEIDITDCIV